MKAASQQLLDSLRLRRPLHSAHLAALREPFPAQTTLRCTLNSDNAVHICTAEQSMFDAKSNTR